MIAIVFHCPCQCHQLDIQNLCPQLLLCAGQDWRRGFGFLRPIRDDDLEAGGVQDGRVDRVLANGGGDLGNRREESGGNDGEREESDDSSPS